MSATVRYPVHVQGRLDPQLSRWLWLVKWLLALPHYIVLALLWVGFVLTSLVAFVAILATGRYPRALFDFNVGVLRWSWRVSYYAYGALGTDRYPPFTLDDVPDYPARLDVDYPEHLSRGLALVKWWLLALPHYLVVGFFVGAATYAVTSDDDTGGFGGMGLIGLLVLVAAVVLAVTGRYPRGVFDLVLGMNRWVLRVAAYAGLMTDAYPPFRLDMGGDDPGSLAVASSTAPSPGSTGAPATPYAATPATPYAATPATPYAATPSVPAAPAAPLSTGRVVGAVLTSLVGLVGLGLLAGGLAFLALDRTQREGGWMTTDTQSLSTGTAALVSEDVRLHLDGAPDVRVEDLLGDVRVTVTSRSSQPVFVGLAERSAAAPYLATFGYDRVVVGGGDGFAYERVGGAVTPAAPVAEDVWTLSRVGTGPQTMTWTPADGDWVLVVMNADGTPGVNVAGEVGAELPILPWLAAGLIAGGAVVLLVSAGLVVALLRR